MAAAFNEIIILPNPFPRKEKFWAWFFTVLPLDFGEVSCICHWYFLLMTLMTKIRGKFWLKNLLTVLNERTATSLGIAFRFGHPLCSWNVKGKAQSKSLWKSTKLLRANDETDVVDLHRSERQISGVLRNLLTQLLKGFCVNTLWVSSLDILGDMLSQLAEHYYWGITLADTLRCARSHMWWKLASKIGWIQAPRANVCTEMQPWELPAGEVSLLSEIHGCPAENPSTLSKRTRWERTGKMESFCSTLPRVHVNGRVRTETPQIQNILDS